MVWCWRVLKYKHVAPREADNVLSSTFCRNFRQEPSVMQVIALVQGYVVLRQVIQPLIRLLPGKRFVTVFRQC